MKLELTIFALLIPSLAFAQGGPDSWTGGLPVGNSKWISSVSGDGQSHNKILKSDGEGDLHINVPTGSTYSIEVGETAIATGDANAFPIYAEGKGPRMSVYVPTFAATPVAGTNDIKKGYNAIPTAAANTAACLPAVPVAGDTFEGFNSMANTVRVKACGTPGINGGAAGTYLPVATMNYFKCVAKSATAYECGTLVVPTPAGP
jgi:hypothetical protein